MAETYELDHDDSYSMYPYAANRDIVSLPLKHADNDRSIR